MSVRIATNTFHREVRTKSEVMDVEEVKVVKVGVAMGTMKRGGGGGEGEIQMRMTETR